MLNAVSTRRWIAAFFISGAGLAHAQDGPVDVTPQSPAHALACLERRIPVPAFPERNALDHEGLRMRVLLRFEKPDAPPKVQVLMSSSGRNDIRELVDRYLAGYRLPCLTPADGMVSPVQEFNFDNSPLAPLPFDDEVQAARRCLVVPPLNQRSGALLSTQPARALVQIRFAGDGEQEPEVKVLYATRSQPGFTRYAVDQARHYTMPCRTAADKPVTFEEAFAFTPAGAPSVGFSRQVMGLMEFLSLTQAPERLEAEFDFNGMDCPFKVNYENRSPFLANRVKAGPPNPNRVAFLKWLAERQLNFNDEKQAAQLFGSTLQVDIPCGVLSLHPQTAAKAGG